MTAMATQTGSHPTTDSRVEARQDHSVGIDHRHANEIPEAIPIAASIVQREEASQNAVEKLQRELETTHAEVAALKSKLVGMDQMEEELRRLRSMLHGAPIAEPVPEEELNRKEKHVLSYDELAARTACLIGPL